MWEEKWGVKSRQSLGIEPQDNLQLRRSSMCSAQVVLNVLVAHLAAMFPFLYFRLVSLYFQCEARGSVLHFLQTLSSQLLTSPRDWSLTLSNSPMITWRVTITVATVTPTVSICFANHPKLVIYHALVIH